MSQKGQELEVSDIINGNPIQPSAGAIYHAKNLNNIKDWITSKWTTWCIPGPYMGRMSLGPDLLAWLRLDDGKLLLLLIQAKCYLEENIRHLFSTCLLTYIQKHKSAKDETLSMLAAINMPDECFTGAQYNILRVVAAYPLDAWIDSERSKIKSTIDANPHPLEACPIAFLSCYVRWYAHNPVSADMLPEETVE